MLVRRYMRDPVKHEVVSETKTVDEMTHRFLKVHEMDRVKVLAAISGAVPRTMVFVRTKRGADRLVSQLKREGVIAGAIHGDLRQSAREKALQDFQAGHHAVLVATDVAARGIHVDDVDVVVHFDPPEEQKGYVHRSGRTARAGREGVVVTFVLWNQELEVERLQKRLGMRVPIVEVFSNDQRLADLDVDRRARTPPQGAVRGELTGLRRRTAVVRSGHDPGLASSHRRRAVHDGRLDRGPVAVRRRAPRPRARSAVRRTSTARSRPRPRREPRSAPPVAAGGDPRHRGAPAARSRRGVRADHRGRSREADQDGPGRSAALRCRTFTFAAVAARTLGGDVVPMDASAAGDGKLAFTLRLPIGVVGAISPFNFPLNLVAHKLAPAIAAGCPVVLKPASQTPLSAIALARLLLDECGLPADQLHVVTGGGGTVGNAIVEHDDIAMITFTGSPEVGWGIKAQAPRKKVGLELGNNAPLIIEPSADVETAAKKVSVAGFSHAGQSCISTQRIYVHRDVQDAFLDALVPLVEGLVVGDPLDERTDVSALISHEGTRPGDRRGSTKPSPAARRSWPAARSARTASSSPTVLGNVTPDMKVCARRGVRPGRRASRPTTTSTRRSGSPTTPATGSRPRSSPPTSTTRCGRRARSTSAACS